MIYTCLLNLVHHQVRDGLEDIFYGALAVS